MNTHEYQAKRLLANYRVEVPPFFVLDDPSQLDAAIEQLGTEQLVIKVQVHAGGRGKAGGVKLVKSRQEAKEAIEKMVGMRIVNNQTGSEGVIASKLLLTAAVDIVKEYYLAIVIDRSSASLSLIASPEGGMEIEEIAAKSPEKLLTLPLFYGGILRGYHLLRLAKFMGWQGEQIKQARNLLDGLGKAFWQSDASMLEVNPLVLTGDGKLTVLDTKLSIDDNALFRHADLQGFYDPTQLPDAEVRAHNIDLSYIALEGNIGCMVNGAGLAMATMDIIKYSGGAPANFLDVGGSATREKVAEGFSILLSDPHVKGILVNIFGGIMDCETIAHGLLDTATSHGVQLPLVVRMEGTNVEKGRALLASSGLKIEVATTLEEAAQKAVKAVNGLSRKG